MLFFFKFNFFWPIIYKKKKKKKKKKVKMRINLSFYFYSLCVPQKNDPHKSFEGITKTDKNKNLN